MSASLKVSEVFIPNDQPTVTYVIRSGRSLEVDLREHFDTKNTVVSISGPSKTGKTVLLRNVLDMEYVISLSGSSIDAVTDFYDQIFNWIEIPVDEEDSQSTTTELAGRASGGGEIGIPLVAKGKANAELEAGRSWSRTKKSRLPNNPFQRIIKEIGNSDFTIFVDDFHYISENIQVELAKIVKGLAENGVRICTASVPHRSEDVVRANPELRGRLAGVDITEWDEEDLIQIANQGFRELNVKIADETIRRLSKYAHGSPQLMQLLCLNLCRSIGIKQSQDSMVEIDVSQERLAEALEVTSTFANSGKITQMLHSGPKVKGQPRMQYQFTDGTRGDVYRAILLGITADPVQKEFTYDDIYNRVRGVCTKEYPTGQSISQSLTYMNNIVEKISDRNSYFEWDDERLYIVDPYLAFYLRCSNKISELGAEVPLH